MIPRDVKAPTVAIPFHKLLKVVAIVDATNAQTKELLDQIAAEGFEVEVRRQLRRATYPRMLRSAPISARSESGRLEEARDVRARGPGAGFPHAALGARRFPRHRRHRGRSR